MAIDESTPGVGIWETKGGSAVRSFDTGATRDTDAGKIDFEGHLSPLALEMFGEYMSAKRQMPDGSRRASDNWQLGMPDDVFIKSLLRHVMDLWKLHRGWPAKETFREAAGGAFFNLQGLMHQFAKREIDGNR